MLQLKADAQVQSSRDKADHRLKLPVIQPQDPQIHKKHPELAPDDSASTKQRIPIPS